MVSRSRTVSARGTLVRVELGKLDRCYQLMETEDRGLLDQWIANDIVDFEAISAAREHHFSTKQYSPSFLSLSGVTADSG
jgi:hypothetical protein